MSLYKVSVDNAHSDRYIVAKDLVTAVNTAYKSFGVHVTGVFYMGDVEVVNAD